MARKNISAQVVRNWLVSEAGQKALKAADVTQEVGKRGRHKPEQVAVFHKNNKGLRYEPTVAEAPTVEVRYPSKDAKGRNISRKKTLTNAEARRILGQPTSTKGKIPLKRLAEALAAAEA